MNLRQGEKATMKKEGLSWAVLINPEKYYPCIRTQNEDVANSAFEYVERTGGIDGFKAQQPQPFSRG
jgi:hypothetical protein